MIRICEKNKQKIEDFILTNEGSRCSSRKAYYANCLHAVISCQQHSAITLMPRKDWVGAIYKYGYGYSFPASYNGSPECTAITIKRRPSGWFLIGAARVYCRTSGYSDLFLNEEQSQDAINRFKNSWTVQKDPETK